MQSYWEVRSAEQSLFSQTSIVFSELDDNLTVEAFWGRSQFLTSGRWWGTRKDCRKGVKLRTVSEVQSRMLFALLNLTRRSWNERKVYKQASMSSLVHICAMEYVQLITTYMCANLLNNITSLQSTAKNACAQINRYHGSPHEWNIR